MFCLVVLLNTKLSGLLLFYIQSDSIDTTKQDADAEKKDDSKEEPLREVSKSMPGTNELNQRVRRLVTAYQREHKRRELLEMQNTNKAIVSFLFDLMHLLQAMRN